MKSRSWMLALALALAGACTMPNNPVDPFSRPDDEPDPPTVEEPAPAAPSTVE